MGLNTTVLIMNDALNEIEKDTKFGEKLSAAINHHNLSSSLNTYISAESENYFCGDAAKVIEMHHSDNHVIIECGGNHGVKLFHDIGVIKYSENRKVEVVKEMAKQLGYRLVKK